MSLGDRGAGGLALGRSTDTTRCWNSRPIHDRARSADSANRKAVTTSAPASRVRHSRRVCIRGFGRVGATAERVFWHRSARLIPHGAGTAARSTIQHDQPAAPRRTVHCVESEVARPALPTVPRRILKTEIGRVHRCQNSTTEKAFKRSYFIHVISTLIA